MNKVLKNIPTLTIIMKNIKNTYFHLFLYFIFFVSVIFFIFEVRSFIKNINVENSNKQVKLINLVQEKNINKNELAEIAKIIKNNYQPVDAKVSEQGALILSAKTKDSYSEWIASINALPALNNKIIWTAVEICTGDCSGVSFYIKLKSTNFRLEKNNEFKK